MRVGIGWVKLGVLGGRGFEPRFGKRPWLFIFNGCDINGMSNKKTCAEVEDKLRKDWKGKIERQESRYRL